MKQVRFFGFTVLLVALLASFVEAEPRNYNQARFYWQWVPDSWTKYFQLSCGTAPGQYTRFAKTTSTSTSLYVWQVVPRVNGIYYCIAMGANDSDSVDPLGDASNETVFKIDGNWVYPQ
jgi:hypothetical protein